MTEKLPEFKTEWREIDKKLHQLRAEGGSLVCGAVIGGCGESDKPEHIGEYWWRAAENSADNLPARQRFGICETLEQAMRKVEEGNKKWIAMMKVEADGPVNTHPDKLETVGDHRRVLVRTALSDLGFSRNRYTPKAEDGSYTEFWHGGNDVIDVHWGSH
jgi:hypothetical protein